MAKDPQKVTNERIANLEAVVTDLNEQLNAEKQKYLACNKLAQDRNQRHTECEENLSKIKVEQMKLQEKIKEQEQQIQKETQKSTEYEKNLIEAENALKEKQKEIESLAESSKTKDEEIKTVSQKLTKTTQEFEQYKEEQQKLALDQTKKQENLQKQINESQSENQKLTEELNERNQELTEKNAEIEALKNAKQAPLDTELKLKDLENQNKNLETEIEDLNSKHQDEIYRLKLDYQTQSQLYTDQINILLQEITKKEDANKLLQQTISEISSQKLISDNSLAKAKKEAQTWANLQISELELALEREKEKTKELEEKLLHAENTSKKEEYFKTDDMLLEALQKIEIYSPAVSTIDDDDELYYNGSTKNFISKETTPQLILNRHQGIHGLKLMENAAHRAVETLENRMKKFVRDARSILLFPLTFESAKQLNHIQKIVVSELGGKLTKAESDGTNTWKFENKEDRDFAARKLIECGFRNTSSINSVVLTSQEYLFNPRRTLSHAYYGKAAGDDPGEALLESDILNDFYVNSSRKELMPSVIMRVANYYRALDEKNEEDDKFVVYILKFSDIVTKNRASQLLDNVGIEHTTLEGDPKEKLHLISISVPK